jgi:hypothetical protein
VGDATRLVGAGADYENVDVLFYKLLGKGLTEQDHE